MKITAVLLSILPALAEASIFFWDHESGPSGSECPDGDKINPGDWAKIHYIGKIDKDSPGGSPGLVFEDTYAKDEPYVFQADVGMVIPGWDKTLTFKCKGAKGNLFVHSSMAYGKEGADPYIPPNTNLMFEIEILEVSSKEILPVNLKVTHVGGPETCAYDETLRKLNHVRIKYTATIDESSETGEKGKIFDSAREYSFMMGLKDRVVKGVEKALNGRCKGAQIIVVVPPELGYGCGSSDEDGTEIVPGDATLKYEIEILDLSHKELPPFNTFKVIDTDEDGQLTKEEFATFFKEEMGKDIPEGLWDKNDKDGDGFITWGEFTGHKGEVTPNDEL